MQSSDRIIARVCGSGFDELMTGKQLPRNTARDARAAHGVAGLSAYCAASSVEVQSAGVGSGERGDG